MTARTTRRRARLTGLITAGACALALASTAGTVATASASPSAGTVVPSAAPGAPAATARAAAPVRSLFRSTPAFRLDRSRGDLTVRPTHFRAASVDVAALTRTLRADSRSGAVRLALPAPDGSTEVVSVVEDSVLEPALQAKYPHIRTYAGTSLTHPGSTVRLDVTPLGFHAFVRGPGGQGSWLVDPAYRGGASADTTGARTAHVSYYGAAVPVPTERMVERELPEVARAARTAQRAAAPRAAGAIVQRRTFRIAFATDPTYATYWGATDEKVLAAKVTLINRVDEVYNDDLAIKFVLINGTDTALNFATKAEATEPNGPCGASACYDPDTFYSDGTTTDGVVDAPDGCTGTLLDRNNFVLGQVVGADSFDIGHIGLGVNGGGVAGLGVVGQAPGLLSSGKAGGCTGLPKPQGDFYAVDYVAHEVGHQMGGNHTFNGVQRNCSGANRNAGTSVEPGSGSSVMAYAGICDSDDLQDHSDPYFSQRSIDEITATVTAATTSVDEWQTVTLAGFDANGDSFTLDFPGATAPITITRGALSYRALLVQQQIADLTGCQVVLGDYDAPTSPAISDAGFTVKFNNPLDCAGTDVPRLVVGGFTGGVTGFVGVLQQGGPSGNQGNVVETTTNHTPAVVAPADKTIPLRTPFTLTASGTDQDGQVPTYLWEQNDVGGTNGTGLVDGAKADGPLFRVFGTIAKVTAAGTLLEHSPGENLATGSLSRTFPDLEQVLADNTNAETGACPAPPADATAVVPDAVLDCYSEFLPTADYGTSMTFRVTARDGFPTGGGTTFDDVTLTIDPSAGPLGVTSRPSPGTTAVGGAAETVTWAVNGTNAAALAPMVRISYSIDGGHTFPYVVAATTPNDGSQEITVPDISTTRARIKVEAVGNYFFDVNDADFTITSQNATFNTRLLGGPHHRSFVIGSTATERFASTVAGATFRCTIDGLYLPCANGEVTMTGLKGGVHRFTVAAIVDGITDPTPAVAAFSVVYDQTVLRRSRTGTRGWRIGTAPGLYHHRAYYTSRGGTSAVLTRKVTGVTRIAVLVSRGPGLGKIGVFLDGRRLRVIDLTNRTQRSQALFRVRNGGAPMNGTVTIRSLSTKPVVVDGIGLYGSDTRNPI